MNRLKLDPLRHLAVPAALLAVIAFNVLAVVLPLAGRSPQQVSALFENMFTPAGWAFSIWSLIYLGLTCFTLYQFLPSQANDRVVQQVAVLFTASCLLNVAWLFAWHNLWIGVSFIIMLALLACVAFIHWRVSSRAQDRTLAHRLMVALPFRIYLGWLLVATMANFMAWQVARGADWAPLGEAGHTLVLFAITVVLGVIALLLRHDLFLNLVLIWALVAVAFGPAASGLTMAGALVAVALIIAAIVWQVLRRRDSTTPPAAARRNEAA